MHPDMAPLKGRPSKGTILDLELKDLEWHAGILHFGHWLVYNGFFWRFGATYAWSWDAPGVPEAPAVQELMLDMVKRYSGEMNVIRARAAVRPIIRRSQPVAGPIPGLESSSSFPGWEARVLRHPPGLRRNWRNTWFTERYCLRTCSPPLCGSSIPSFRPTLNGTCIFLVKAP